MLTQTLLPLIAKSEAEKAGEIFGGVVISVLLLLGIIKCFRISARKTTSTLCLLSLALVLMSFFLSGISRTILNQVELPANIEGLLTGLFGVLMMILLLGGAVVAIVGLSLYRSPREVPHEQGKAQAIWALVLGLLPIAVGIGIGISTAFSNSSALSESDVEPREAIENEELNFRVTLPGRPWVELDPSTINEEASVALRKRFPESLFILIAEQAGIDSGMDRTALVDIAKANLQAVKGNLDITDLPDQTINGIDFAIFQTRARNFNGNKATIWFEHRVAMHNGYGYQLAFLTMKDDKEEVANVAEDLTKHFSLLDPDKVLHSIGPPINPVKNAEAGFSIDLSQAGWTDYTEQETDFPESLFAASKGVSQSTGINTAPLGAHDPGADHLAAGLVRKGFNFEHPADTRARKEIQQGVASGIEICANRELEGKDYVYVFRALRHEDHSWLLSAWGLVESPETENELRKVLDEYEIYKPQKTDVEPPEAILESHAGVFNNIGISYYTADNHKAAIPYFDEAFQRSPESIQFFKNSIDSMMLSLQHREAIARIESEPDWLKQEVDLQIFKAQCHFALDEFSEAQAAYEKVFESDYSDEGILLDFINVIVELEQQEKGIAALEKFREKHPDATSSIERWKASLLGQLERYDEAIEMLEALHIDSPADLNISTLLISTNLDAGNFTDGLEKVEELISNGTRNGKVFLLKGRAKLGLMSYREAKVAFDEANRLSPGDPVVADYLEHTSTLLGKSNIALIKEPIEEVPLPTKIAELSERLRKKNGDHLESDFGVIYLRLISGYFFEKGKPQKTTYRREMRITDSNGLDDYSTLQFAFDPAFEKLFVNEVTVSNEEGDVVARGVPENYFILDDTNDGLADTKKLVHVPVPGLKVGYTLRYTVTREDFANSDEVDFLDRPMSSTNPSTGSIVYFLADESQLKSRQTGGVEELSFEGGKAFFTDRPAIRHYETSQPWVEEFHPWLTVGSTRTTWEKEVKSYLKRLDPILVKDTESAAEKAREIVGNPESTTEKIEKISDFVSSTLTYQGIEFGPRGQIPDQFSTILKNRYGDCKDHSLMLVKLLREQGIEAHLALVSFDAPIKEDIPSLDQFDHMIAYIKDYPGSPFFDGTSDHFPSGKLSPSAFLYEKALVLDPENPRLEEIKPTPDSMNLFRSTRNIRVDPDNPRSLLVDETLLLDGYPATWLRNSFHDWKARDYAKQVTRILQNDGAPTVLDISLKSLKDRRKPFTIEMKYRLNEAVWKQGDDLAMELPSVWENYFLEHASVNERHNPFEILIGSEFVSTCIIDLPKGSRPKKESLSTFSTKHPGEIIDWEFSQVSDSESHITLQSIFRKKTGSHPAGNYKAYTRAANLGLDSWNRPLLLSREAKENAPAP